MIKSKKTFHDCSDKRKDKKLIRTIGSIVLLVTLSFTACGNKANKAADSTDTTVDEISDATAGSIDENGISDSGEADFDTGLSDRISYQCTEEESDDVILPTDRNIKIMFSGNSLLGAPKVDKHFEELVERYQLNVDEVIREIFYGESIQYQLSLIDDDNWDFVKEDYENADVIIFQEYGGFYEQTYENIKELVDNYCKEDVVVYYYTTQYDYHDTYLKKMAEDESIHVLDFGTLFNRLDSSASPTFGYLYQSDGHPNELAGFIAAGYIYTQLYKTDFTDYPYEELPDNIKELVPGGDDSEKQEFYDEMIEMLNRGVLN